MNSSSPGSQGKSSSHYHTQSGHHSQGSEWLTGVKNGQAQPASSQLYGHGGLSNEQIVDTNSTPVNDVDPGSRQQQAVSASWYQQVNPGSWYQQVNPGSWYQQADYGSWHQQTGLRSWQQQGNPGSWHQQVNPGSWHQEVGSGVPVITEHGPHVTPHTVGGYVGTQQNPLLPPGQNVQSIQGSQSGLQRSKKASRSRWDQNPAQWQSRNSKGKHTKNQVVGKGMSKAQSGTLPPEQGLSSSIRGQPGHSKGRWDQQKPGHTSCLGENSKKSSTHPSRVTSSGDVEGYHNGQRNSKSQRNAGVSSSTKSAQGKDSSSENRRLKDNESKGYHRENSSSRPTERGHKDARGRKGGESPRSTQELPHANASDRDNRREGRKGSQSPRPSEDRKTSRDKWERAKQSVSRRPTPSSKHSENRSRSRFTDRDERDSQRNEKLSQPPRLVERQKESRMNGRDERNFQRGRGKRSLSPKASDRQPKRQRGSSPVKGQGRRFARERNRSNQPFMNRDQNIQDRRSSYSEQSLNSRTNARWNELEEASEKERKEEELLESIISTSSKVNLEEEEGDTSRCKWVQSSSRENYYTIDPACQSENSTVAATQSLKDLLARFKRDILDKCTKAKADQPKYEIPLWGYHHRHHHHHHHHNHSEGNSSSESDSSGEEGEIEEESKEIMDAATILELKEKHPARLAKNLWYNDKGQLNDRPACRCSSKSQKVGIRHNIYPGEKPYPVCDPFTNNLKALHHYVIELSPSTNFISPSPTVIKYDDREYIFEGLSLFSHVPIDDVPPCNFVRYGIEYKLSLVKQDPLENFVVQELDYFSDFLFTEILELYDFDYMDKQGGCRRFHFMPRFARLLPNKGTEILSMHQVMSYLLNCHKPVISEDKLADILEIDEIKWARFLDFIKGMIVIAPGKKPSSVRVDQVDRDDSICTETEKRFPLVIHAGARPPQLLYISDPEYRKLHKQYLCLRHLIRNRKSHEDQQTFINIQNKLANIRRDAFQSKEVTSEIDSSKIFITGIRSDICQHALVMPVVTIHVRYFLCLDQLNEDLGNIFTSKTFLKRAMTHPSYRLTFGMNSDHIRNSIFNCGFRRPEMGDKSWRQMEIRKRGIINLVKIMSRLAEEEEVQSNIHHYERLEFLGDAVAEFITSTTLYHLFPNLEEGGLAVYRQALVENQHLAKLARKLKLGSFMLYAHGQDLCRDQDLRHAEANCLEALLGAIYLECGIETARKVFCGLLFEDEVLSKIWFNFPKHPLQLQFPEGDRHMIPESPVLQKIVKFEESTGIRFKHIRLLARAFTHRTVGFTDLTLGHNQRMEFLGDSVLQLIVSEYLFKHFPEHHEGHLSLLRSSLVNNKTQAIVCQDLGMEKYIVDVTASQFAGKGLPLKMQADLVEALVGAMYVDRGLEAVEVFCNVCFFPRLREFIIEQDWNDDKSKLQQVVLTLRKMGEAPDIPQYKLLKKSGPTNSTMFTVAVFFRNERIGKGTADSVRAAEKMAAKDALEKGHYEQIKFQTKLMSSLYPDEYRPPEMGKGRPSRERSLPKQYALESTRNRRKDGGKDDQRGRSVS